jgi:cation:H+ antiporter
MTDPELGIIFAAAAAISLLTSWRLVVSLERLGARLGFSEALLGMLAAFAADAPEITAAVTALLGHEDRIGAGVVLGSNVFNLAALLGLAGIVAGHIALHRRVVELAGAVALWIAGVALLLVLGVVSALGALLLGLAVFVPYLFLLGMPDGWFRKLPERWAGWLSSAITEEEQELHEALDPSRGRRRDAAIALAATVVVVGASIAMEQTAAKLGDHHHVPAIVIGGIVLAAVTSLPNAVAGVYLAMRSRGPAVLSTSLNSNAINVLAGLLIPTTFVGVAAPSPQTTFVAASYAAITLLALIFAYTRRGLARAEGVAIVGAYLLFAAILIAIAS